MAQAKGSKRSSKPAANASALRSAAPLFDEAGSVVDPTGLDQVSLSLYYPLRERVLLDLANLHDLKAAEWFWRKWSGTFRLEPAQDLVCLRDDLRRIWLSKDTAVTAESSSDLILDRWLAWRPTSELSQHPLGRWETDDGEDKGLVMEETDLGEERPYLPFRCAIRLRRLVPNVTSLRSMLVQGVLEHWGHLKYCANPYCMTPYFIGKRKDQTVCDAEICKAERQREHARKWWNQNRAKKARSQERTVSKTAKKESKGNVTRKAR